MKNKIIYIFIAVSFLGFSSCSDFLDKYPEGELSDASFWKSKEDAESAVSAAYATLDNFGTLGQEAHSENAVWGIKWAAGNESRGIYDPADQGWSGKYSNIRKTNLVLQKIKEITLSKEDEEKITGQAYFLRAYTYFNLIRRFGDVPYIDKPLTISDSKGLGRTPRDEVYAKLMEDLDQAINTLPLEWEASEWGRVTKGAAYALKARAALYYGKWNVARDASKAVIDLNKYDLYDKNNTGNYKKLFWEETDGCEEVILAVQYKNPDKKYFLGFYIFPTIGWGGLNPTQSLVDAFEDIDGAPISKSKIYNEKKPFENRDPRLAVNILRDGDVKYGVNIKVAPLKSSGVTGIGQHGDATASGYYTNKFCDEKFDYKAKQTGKDWVDIRYAEVLLTYAESVNELSALDAAAFEAVNKVRRRVGMPDLQNTDATKPTYCATQDDLRQRIRNEWRVEFALEGKRKWDIRRWGIAKKVLNEPYLGLKYKVMDDPSANPLDGGKICILYEGENIKLTGSSYEDINYIYPVPQVEMDKDPSLVQNPGYGAQK